MVMKRPLHPARVIADEVPPTPKRSARKREETDDATRADQPPSRVRRVYIKPSHNEPLLGTCPLCLTEYVSGQQVCHVCGHDELPVDETGKVKFQPNRKTILLERRMEKLNAFSMYGTVNQSLLASLTDQQAAELRSAVGVDLPLLRLRCSKTQRTNFGAPKLWATGQLRTGTPAMLSSAIVFTRKARESKTVSSAICLHLHICQIPQEPESRYQLAVLENIKGKKEQSASAKDQHKKRKAEENDQQDATASSSGQPAKQEQQVPQLPFWAQIRAQLRLQLAQAQLALMPHHVHGLTTVTIAGAIANGLSGVASGTSETAGWERWVRFDFRLKSGASAYTATSPVHSEHDVSAFLEESQDVSRDQLETQGVGTLPFRALDLLEGNVSFKREVIPIRSPVDVEQGDVPEPSLDLFAADPSDAQVSQVVHELDGHESLHSATDESVEVIEPEADAPAEEPEEAASSDAVAPMQTWNEMVSSSFAQFRAVPNDLLYPWEVGPMAAVFNFDADPLPLCPGLAELPPSTEDAPSTSLQHQLSRFLMPEDAKYMHAVKSIQDMSYFEGKAQQLELACGQWLRILSVSWSSSGVGPQLAAELQKDSTGVSACEILRACFGVKSPSTLLKRASAFKKFFSWYEKNQVCQEMNKFPLPLEEPVIWEYFLHLKQQRELDARGYTVPSAFLEAVRFAKFTLDMSGTDSILGSRRLLGFSALEKKAKGPTVQAPGLEPEHIQRLHEVLRSAGNSIDKLGAGCFLVCLYGRARWSDMRFIDHVVIEAGDSVTFYTTEHKTASFGLRRQQYLPIVVPWQGICSDSWLEDWLQVYHMVGLDITKRPLGPLLPAPRIDGTFCARPLSTAEAASWLRALLQGTSNSDSYRSHSLKASLLIWCARAGLDKETRAVLGHHCSALSGSEVVYSRHLQTRALRKLGLILRRVRSGLSIEDEAMKEYGIVSTPAPFTPAMAARTPLGPAAEPMTSKPDQPLAQQEKAAVDAAVEEAANLEDLQSVKEEEMNTTTLEEAAAELTLYPVELVSAGVVEIESSSGSDSESSSTDSESSSSETVVQAQAPHMVEEVPSGMDFYKHTKSGLVHSCKEGQETTSCKIQIGVNFKKLGRRLFVVHPKCIRCFPKNHNRIRSCDQMSQNIDAFLKRAKASDSKES
eukprot:s4578_g1.t1